MKDLYLNCVDNPITFNKKNYLLRAAKRLNLEWVKDWNQDMPAIADYVLNIEPYSKFVKGYQWTGIWNIDMMIDKDWKLPDWDEADSIFTAIGTYPNSVKPYKDRINILFQACDPVLHRRMPEIEQEYDFIVCGTLEDSMHQERKRLVNILEPHFKFKDLGKDKVPEDYVKMLNLAKIQWIRSMGNSWEMGELAQRFFECMAIGPVLTNFSIDLPHTGFKEGTDYVCYRSDTDLLEKMRWMLDNYDACLKMSAQARWKCLLYHTYEQRLMTILQVINEHVSKGKKG